MQIFRAHLLSKMSGSSLHYKVEFCHILTKNTLVMSHKVKEVKKGLRIAFMYKSKY